MKSITMLFSLHDLENDGLRVMRFIEDMREIYPALAARPWNLEALDVDDDTEEDDDNTLVYYDEEVADIADFD